MLLLQVMERLIEFAYTASISVGEKCVIHMMNGAVMYQIDSVVKACCDFLVQQLDPSNAIGIANFAEQIGCTELHQKAREYIYMNFSQVRSGIWEGNRPFYLDTSIQLVQISAGVPLSKAPNPPSPSVLLLHVCVFTTVCKGWLEVCLRAWSGVDLSLFCRLRPRRSSSTSPIASW